MNVVEQAMQRVASLDEETASKLIEWLDRQQTARPSPSKQQPLGAQAMIGFALHRGRGPRTTAEWMKDLRDGESASY